MNQIYIVGRLVGDPTLNKITLAVARNFKNAEGVYETDFLDIQVNGIIAQHTVEFCRKGDLIGVRGRAEQCTIDDGDGHLTNAIKIVADKITFLSNRNGGE